MGIRTTADEALEDARENINKAYKKLHTVLDSDTWGHEDFTSERIDELHEIALKLLQLKRKL